MKVTPIGHLGVTRNGTKIDSLDTRLLHDLWGSCEKDGETVSSKALKERLLPVLALFPEQTPREPGQLIDFSKLRGFNEAEFGERVIVLERNERGHYTLMLKGGDPDAPTVD